MPCPSPCPGVCPGHVNYISDAIQPSHPLMASPPSALSLSQYQGLFQWVIHLSTSDDQKYWSFSISPFSEYSGLISLTIDWFDLLAVQGTLRSLLQHHSSKASILWCSTFFMVQLSQPYLTTGKTITLTIWTFVDYMDLMFLLFNILCRFVIAFLSRSKHLLISRLQSLLQWFWSPRRENLSLLLPVPLLFAIQ